MDNESPRIRYDVVVYRRNGRVCRRAYRRSHYAAKQLLNF